MALTPEVRSTQAVVRIVEEASTADLRATQTKARAIYNVPTESERITQATVRSISESDVAVQVTQNLVRSIVRGRVFNPKVRTWTYTLDGHDHYVLRLGETETLDYDTYSKEWAVYGSGETSLWKAATGCNWLGGNRLAAVYGSNVVVGDENNGALYFLDPDYDYEDHSILGADEKLPFEREVQAQVVLKGYDSVSCYGVELEGSIGSVDEFGDTLVNLTYSDDRGNTYQDAGSIAADVEEYSARLNWQSLGSMKGPGRLFKITDNGALKRIDTMEAATDLEG